MNQKHKRTINIGIFAHVDAGKTTITENLLFQCGVLKERGRVDKGDTLTDSMIQERERGISIQAAPVSFRIDDVKVNLIDTPGHVDFVAEVERTINVLDGAILVLSAKEGVQPHTHLLFNSLKKLDIPIIFFLNKIDRAGCDVVQVLSDIKTELTPDILPVQSYFNTGFRDASVSDLFDFPIEESWEFLADHDDSLLHKFLNDETVPSFELEGIIEDLSRKARIYPLLYGSALVGTGIEALKRSISMFIPSVEIDEGLHDEPSWQVFKISRSADNIKETYVRVYSGTIRLWDTYGSEKITRILILKEGGTESVSSLPSGEIGIIHGLKTLKVNDSFGDVTHRKSVTLGKPTLRYAVSPVSLSERSKLLKGIDLIAESDPYLEYDLHEKSGALYLNLFGEIQMEILKDILLRDHGVAIDFLKPEIICKEAVRSQAESYISVSHKVNPYTASMGIKVEPNHPGDGIRIESHIPQGDMGRGLLKGAVDGIKSSLRQGLRGWEITDSIITVTEVDFFCTTTPVDFRNLAPMVLFEALEKAGTTLLWPLLSFDISIDERFYGRVMEDLIKRQARDIDIVEKSGRYNLKGIIPADQIREYEKQFVTYSGGKNNFSTLFNSYEKAPKGYDKEGKKLFPDPLNKAQYLMSKKGMGP